MGMGIGASALAVKSGAIPIRCKRCKHIICAGFLQWTHWRRSGGMFWSMLPDTVEYGQWRSGVRDDGIVFGLSQLISKAGSGLGVGMIGLLLSAIGYTAGIEQSAATLQGIRASAFLIPQLPAHFQFWLFCSIHSTHNFMPESCVG